MDRLTFEGRLPLVGSVALHVIRGEADTHHKPVLQRSLIFVFNIALEGSLATANSLAVVGSIAVRGTSAIVDSLQLCGSLLSP